MTDLAPAPSPTSDATPAPTSDATPAPTSDATPAPTPAPGATGAPAPDTTPASPAAPTPAAAPSDAQRELEPLLGRHRRELTGYCYRMLGSPHEAEDAVQETMLRAWRAFDRFEGRAAVRSWLFRIATNVCIEMLRGRKRRALPVDVAAPADGRGRPGPPLPESTWVHPAPDGRTLPDTDDPAEQAVARESVRLAFVAALQHLSPRQRAVLILRDVLRWRAREVADLLETTVVSVNSALQRGRAALAAVSEAVEGPEGLAHPLDDPTDPDTQAFLERYVDAFQRFDVERLVALLHEDVTFDMPPVDLWLRGTEAFARWAAGTDQVCRHGRFVPVGTANGSPAYGFYHRDQEGGDGFHLAGVHVVEVVGGRVVAAHAYLDPALGPLFDLPPHLPGPTTPAGPAR